MADFAIFRLEKVKSVGQMVHRSIHNNRLKGMLPTDQSEQPKIKTIVYGGTPLGEVVRKRQTYADFFKEQLKRFGIKKVRKNAVVGFELVFTYSKSDKINNSNLRDWVEATMNFVINNFGAHNLYEAKLHKEGMETSNHLHILLSPIVYDEKKEKYVLAANRIIDSPQKLTELQDKYAAAMEPFGLERGLKRVDKEEHKKAMKWWAEQSKNERRLEAYEKTFGTEKDWSIDEVAEFNMLAKPELKEKTEKPVINRIQIEH